MKTAFFIVIASMVPNFKGDSSGVVQLSWTP